MAVQPMQEETKTITMETGLENGSGVNEESTCLPTNKRSTAGRIEEVRSRIVGDTRLSPGVRIAGVLLAVLCVVLFFIVIIMAICWPTKSYAGTVCSTPGCLRLSASISEKMESGVNPCESPKTWACGKWMEQNAKRVPSRSKWSPSEEIRFNELVELRDALTTMPPTSSSDSLEWKMSTLYESCMAVGNVEADGIRPLLKIIYELGGWHVRRDFSSLSWSWRQTLERLHSRYGATPLFAISVKNQDNSTYIHVQPSGLGLPDPSYYVASAESKAVRAYKALLKDVALSFDALTADAAMFADDVFAFEQRLAKIQMSEEFYQDGKSLVIPFSVLNEQAQFLQLQDILKSIFPKLSLADNDKLLISSPKYVTHLSSITTGTETGILNDYFIWTLVRQYLPFMSRQFRLIWREFQSQITGGTEDVERWELCADLVRNTVPLGVTALLQHRQPIQEQSITAATAIFEALKSTTQNKVIGSRSISEQTKSLMLAQINSLKLQVGLRSEEKQPSFLMDYHKSFYVQKQNLFQNIAFGYDFQRELLNRSYFDKEMQGIKARADALLQPEATFIELTNEIIVPRTLLVPPYFNEDFPRAAQYGMLGATIATAVMEALAINDPDAESIVPEYAQSSISCLNRLLSSSPSQRNVSAACLSKSSNAFVTLLAADVAREVALLSHSNILVLPQLEKYGQENIFAAAYAQMHCLLETSEQKELDSFTSQLDGDQIFSVIWPQMRGLSESLGCRKQERCPSPL